MITDLNELIFLIKKILASYNIKDGWLNIRQEIQDQNIKSTVQSYIKKFNFMRDEVPFSDINHYRYPSVAVGTSGEEFARVLVVEIEDMRDGTISYELNQSLKIDMGLVEEKNDEDITYKIVNDDKSTEKSLIKQNNSFSMRWIDINNILKDDEAIFLFFNVRFYCETSLINQLNDTCKIVRLPASGILYERTIRKEESLVRIIGKRIIKKKFINNFIKNLFSIGYNLDGTVKYFDISKRLPLEYQIQLVYFDRRVLSKYEQSQYFIVDSMMLHCKGTNGWQLQIHNNNVEIISVFLVHIKTQLPKGEYKHWMAYNLLPSPTDRGLTQGELNTSGYGIPHIPDRSDHRFKWQLEEYWKQCDSQNKKAILKKLNQIDNPYFNTLNLISENSQWHFDLQILCLSKIIIESVDVDELSVKGIENNGQSKNMLKLYIEKKTNTSDYFDYKNFLDNLYNIRIGAAHRRGLDLKKDYYKGMKYFKEKYGENLVSILNGIFIECGLLLETLANIEN